MTTAEADPAPKTPPGLISKMSTVADPTPKTGLFGIVATEAGPTLKTPSGLLGTVSTVVSPLLSPILRWLVQRPPQPIPRGPLTFAAKVVPHLTSLHLTWVQAPAQARLLGRLLGGGYDGALSRAAVQESVKSAPVVVYSYRLSPFCVEAITVLRSAGVDESKLKIVEPGFAFFLLGPEGAATRASLGELFGQTSLPHVFIGGESIGGLFTGTPGLKMLVEDGSLMAQLKAAGAL